MPGSGSTTGSTTSGPRSGSASSRSSTGSWPAASEVAARYGELLADIEGLRLPCPDDADHERSWFVYVVELPEEADREAVIGALEAHGIGTARYLPCIHLQSYMRERYGFAEGLCPVAEAKSRARWRFRSTPGSPRTTRHSSPTRSAAPLGRESASRSRQLV